MTVRNSIIPNVDTFGFYTWGHVAFDELRWVVLVDMLGSEETPEHNDHIPEGDYYSSNNSPLPFPQFQLSSRHSSTSFRFCHHFQTLLILPTTVLKEI